MANSLFQLNYDQLVSIAKKFKDEGEDIARLHSTTRQRVRDLHKEWIGDAAEKFFEEMETELLPAVQRLAHALFLSQDVTNAIMKIIQAADEETVGYFRNQLSGDDFGASLFGSALNGLQGGSPGADDFGAGKFGEASGNVTTGDSTAADDFGAGKFGEALDHSTPTADDGSSGTPGENNSSQGSEQGSQKSEKEQQTETEPSPTGGGGGGSSSSSSQGLQGDLKKMGVGLSDQAAQHSASGGSGGSANTPDHIYSGGDSPKSDGVEPDSSKPGIETGSGDSAQPSSAGGSVAGGVAGVAGAAAAGKVAKTAKKQQENSD
jgi:WXG100 family type VII secretion target